MQRTRILLTIVAMLAALTPAAAPAQDGTAAEAQVFAGAERIETAALIAEAQAPSDTVVVTRADDFPDALAGALLGAPIVLTTTDALPSRSAEAIEALGASEALVLGGPAAVGEAVVDELEAMGLDVYRLAGDGRVATAAAIATHASGGSGSAGGPTSGGSSTGDRTAEGTAPDGGTPTESPASEGEGTAEGTAPGGDTTAGAPADEGDGTVGGKRTAIVALADDYPDALVAGPLSAAERLPLLLTGRDSLPAETMDTLAVLGIERVLLVGGTAAVSPDVEGSLRDEGYDVTRLAGDSRQATAAAVADFARAELGWQPQAVVLATGSAFPDALAAAPFAGSLHAPILLTGGTTAVDTVASLVGCAVATVYVAGGPGAVPESEITPVLQAAATGDACAFAPQTTPSQANVRVGATHEVVMDTRALADDPAYAQDGAGAAQVRFTAVPDTYSIAVATPVPAEATIPVDADGRATLELTSTTPGLAVVQACVSGEDGEEVCQDVAVTFSARYAAALDGGTGYVSVDDLEGGAAEVCMGTTRDDVGELALLGQDGETLATVFGPTGCYEVNPAAGLTQAQVDAAPADYSLSVNVGDGVPLTVIGSDYATYSPTEVAPFVPGPATQSNTELLANIPEVTDVTAINFIDYGDRDVLFATGSFGLKSFDITDPTAPTLLDSEDMPDFWENEDMTVDSSRQLVFLSRDPRSYGGSTDTGVAGIYIIDASDPANLTRIVFHELPAGHTASCVRSTDDSGELRECDFLWSGGPATGTHQPADWGGRPIFVTDIRDPQRPFTYPTPLLLNQNDGVTDYAHDVQLDADGLAWVSSRGGVYGFHTFGEHTDPLTGETREATPANPVPFAGGKLQGEDTSTSGVIHNAYRPVGDEAELGADLAASGFPEGDLIYATDEAFTSACTTDGLFNIVTLEGSYEGAGFDDDPAAETPFRLRTVGTWSPVAAGEPGPIALCSAHYFDMKDRIVAYSWYGQGTRFIDVTDPTAPIQVAFHRPLVNSSFAPKYRGDVVFVADSMRGIDVIRLTEGAYEAQAAHTQVLAPPLPTIDAETAAASLAGSPVTIGGRTYGPDPAYGWNCWIRR